jgi:hypothetical protein
MESKFPHPAIVTSVEGNKIGLVPVSHKKVSDKSTDVSKLTPSIPELSGHAFLGEATADLKDLLPATGKLKGKVATSDEISDLLGGTFDASTNALLI